MKKHLIGSFWLIFIAHYSLAQMLYLQKKTFPLSKSIDEEYKVIPLAEKGLLLLKFQDKEEREKRTKIKGKPLLISRLDTNLQNYWSDKYIIPFDFFHKQTLQYYYDELNFKLYLFFVAVNQRDFVVFKLNLDTGVMENYEGKSPVNLEISEFKVLGETLFAYGTLNMRSVAFYFNFIEKVMRFVPSFYSKHQDILAMQLVPEQNTIYFVVFDRRKYLLSIRPFSTLLGLGKEIVLRDRDDYTLKTAWIYPKEAQNSTIIGTYGIGAAEFLQGIFTLQVRDNKQENLVYHSFANLKRFFDHYKPAKVERIKKRISRYKAKGKNLYLTYNLYAHPKPIANQEEQIFVFENYYLNYRSSNFTSMRGYIGLGQVFDGYVKRYAAIVAMDKQGTILWDNIFKIDEAKQMNLAPTTQIGKYADSLVLCYVKEDKIFSKVIYKQHTIREEKEQKLTEIFVLDRKDDFENNELLAWYNNNFLLFGREQKRWLWNSTNHETIEKDFFYLSKIRYQHLSNSNPKKP
ncbi:MAG: hypothetical protein NZ551_06785 [Microscillaceae bacterium]|nr:hypothetical protein [Microscillaceae bacterium]MDW8460900.1 hypothetical protein [Cytophagales bacterium]